ncbi:uncharacterized protein LOC130190905, partial [Pseudoliparis swirei]|uniref:uncharacterized protein LOC130190905 n=1 Tax=Pseudoliparis swirei TaxID=2059687 RepID=UPI0024BDFCD1
MFRKTPKEKPSPSPSSPAVTVSKAESDSEDTAEPEDQEKRGFFSKKPNRRDEAAEQDGLSGRGELSASNDSLSDNGNKKEKGGIFSGILRKSPKIPAEGAAEQEKGGAFGGMFKKSPKPPEEAAEPLHGELSASTDSLSEKGGVFGGLLKKTHRPREENLSAQKSLSASSDSLTDGGSTKEKGGGAFGALFRKSPRAAEEEAQSTDDELSGSREALNVKERAESPEREAREELSAGDDQPAESAAAAKEKNIFSNMFKKPQKPAEDEEPEEKPDVWSSGSCENLSDNVPKEKRGGLAGIFKRSVSVDDLFDEEKGLFSGLKRKTPKGSEAEDSDAQKEGHGNAPGNAPGNAKEKSMLSAMFKKTPKAAEDEVTTSTPKESNDDKKLSASRENLLDTSKEKTGGLSGIFKKSPKLAPRSVANQDPLQDSKDLSASCDSLTEDAPPAVGETSTSNDNLSEATSTPKEKTTGFSNMFKKTPKTQQAANGEDTKEPERGGLKRRRTIRRKKRVVSFRVKRTLPEITKLNRTSERSDMTAIMEESFELQELNVAPENRVEIQPVEMAAYPTEENPLTSEQETDDDLMDWWNTVKGWAEWNEASHLQEGDEQMLMQQAADRVYMAARLFVRLFNRRGALLQRRILELLAMADAADEFHKKTVQAAVGGGVASIAGSIATITGLILAPFTFGASIIVTAVGIGVATAGSITSATANITDTVRSNMERKRLEKMIQGYQDDIKDIRQCLEFVQAGMDTLQEWDFEKFSESVAKKAMNHNLKHVMKEGGRAGKALMINTDKLISTVQVLGVAGGAAKAVQAISITTGVMSALFLALDVFFLAKDSHELRKGAKTKFATKIRDVCKELQDGLLELNRVKTALQKTMDGIEVEEYEEVQEVEEEVDDDDEDESDPRKLAEQDLLEEKLDRKVEEEKKKKSKEMEKKDKEEVEEEKEKKKKSKEMEKDKEEVEEEKKSKEMEKDKEEVEEEKKKKSKEMEKKDKEEVEEGKKEKEMEKKDKEEVEEEKKKKSKEMEKKD